LQSFDRILVEAKAEPWRRPGKAEKYDLADRPQGARLARCKQRVANFAGLEHDEFAADKVTPGLRVFAIFLERGIITAARCGAVKSIGGVAKRPAWAAIRTRRHGQEPGHCSDVHQPPPAGALD